MDSRPASRRYGQTYKMISGTPDTSTCDDRRAPKRTVDLAFSARGGILAA